jgi:hypothetical protein
MYLLATFAPEEGIIFSSFLLLDIAVLKGMLSILGSLRVVIVIF